MPGNKVKTLKALQSRKSSISSKQVHPNSRRAKQLQRVELRSKKLEVQSKVQRSTEVKRIDRHLYFVHAIPEESEFLTLPELHQLVQDYIDRDSAELVELAAERDQRKKWRSGEGKSKREIEIEKQMEADKNEYKSGFIVPDLTIPENVYISRQWVNPAESANPSKTHIGSGGDPSFLGRIRLVRINSDNKDTVIVVQDGARAGEWRTAEEGLGEVDMK